MARWILRVPVCLQMAGDSKGAGAARVDFHSQAGYVKLVKTNDSPISYIPVKERVSRPARV